MGAAAPRRMAASTGAGRLGNERFRQSQPATGKNSVMILSPGFG